jgi:peptidoglycan/LPS O-acetylase OafA/YrhL
MDPVSILPILPILLLSLCVVSFTSRWLGIGYQRHRYTSIDGLRGFLAMFVFLHHSAIWYYFLRTHQWDFPPSYLYSHFGPTSVALFFMITAFLFFSKLIDAVAGDFDWLKLYVSRVLRILPLYAVAVFALFVVAAAVSHFVVREPLEDLWLELVQWIFFIEADINLIYGTKLLIAGVVWSLAFEWLFYFSLGLIGPVFFRIRTSLITVVVTGLFFLLFVYILYDNYPYGAWNRLSPFLCGIVAAFAVRNEKVRKIGSKVWLTPVLLVLLFVALYFYPTVFDLIPLVCMTIGFIAICCGNSLFGILTSKACCLLGQISYSIYLLHGLLLFITFRFIIGFPVAARLTPLAHWGIITACSVAVVSVCSLTYYFVERPCLNSASGATKKLRRFLTENHLISAKA